LEPKELLTKKTAVEVICYGLGARRACQIADNLNPPNGEHTKHEQRIVVVECYFNISIFAKAILGQRNVGTPQTPWIHIHSPFVPKKSALFSAARCSGTIDYMFG
jgi:hypothetical protein